MLVGYASSSEEDEVSEAGLEAAAGKRHRKEGDEDGDDKVEPSPEKKKAKKVQLPKFGEAGGSKVARRVKQEKSSEKEGAKSDEVANKKSPCVLVPPQVKSKRKNINTEDYGKWFTNESVKKMSS